MLRLSRPAWNNVIIFSILAFILLINYSQQDLFNSEDSSAAQEQALMPDNGMIVGLQIAQQVLIERIGNSWRAAPATLSGQRLAQMMASWQIIQGQLIERPLGLNPNLATVVTVWFAGQEQPRYYSLYLTKQQLLVHHHSRELWFSLARPLYFQLLPPALVNNSQSTNSQ